MNCIILPVEFPNLIPRRNFLRNTLLSTRARWTTPDLFTEALRKMPRWTENPIYLDRILTAPAIEGRSA